jgi:formate-dependent phosphoribosylglycinamide formyltransferase (GAR transformylase)
MRNIVFVAPYWAPATKRFANACGRLQNVRLLGICHFKPEGFQPSESEGFAHLIQVNDCFNADDVERAARGLANVYGPIHRIVGVLEQIQTTVAEVRDRLGIPGMSRDAANRFFDKTVMKNALRAAGLPCARHALLKSPDEGRAFAREVGYPVVLKPPRGAGCRGTYQANNAQELEAALADTKPTAQREVQIEEFLMGDEHSFDTVTLKGEPIFHSISRYHPTPLDAVRNEWIQWRCVLPRDISGPEFDDIRKIGVATVKALGMQSGITHMEWFRRPNGAAVVGEIAARPPGAQIASMIAQCYGVDIFRVWARAIIDEAFDGPFERRYAAGTVFLRGTGRGRIAAVEGVDAANREIGQWVVESKLPLVGSPKFDGYEGDGWVTVRHPETEKVYQILDVVVKHIKIRYSG